jgi:hypothetical protein
VGTLVVMNTGEGAGDEAIEFDAIRNKPDLPAMMLFTGVAEYGIQNPPEPPPLAVHVTFTVTLADAMVPEPSLVAQV